MWRCRETELYWVSTNIRSMPEWMALLMGMSIRRYLPAMGTAGLLRRRVNGSRRAPRPPPRITTMTSEARFQVMDGRVYTRTTPVVSRRRQAAHKRSALRSTSCIVCVGLMAQLGSLHSERPRARPTPRRISLARRAR